MFKIFKILCYDLSFFQKSPKNRCFFEPLSRDFTFSKNQKNGLLVIIILMKIAQNDFFLWKFCDKNWNFCPPHTSKMVFSKVETIYKLTKLKFFFSQKWALLKTYWIFRFFSRKFLFEKTWASCSKEKHFFSTFILKKKIKKSITKKLIFENTQHTRWYWPTGQIKNY